MGKAERTKQFIIEKTATLFNTKGIAATSLQDMTEATGLTKGSIYGNFKNKDEVALEVFRYNFKKVTNLVAEEMARESTFRGKILCYPRIYTLFNDPRFPVGGCVILNTAIEVDDTLPFMCEEVSKAINSWKNTLIFLINEGIKAGEFRSENKAEDLALQIIAIIEGAVMLTKVSGKLDYMQSLMKTVENLINSL
ncbi:TetR/AcrR family transcriptional regulator [Flectobacillus sp. BAB-3569]|jgi:AcrR family transcriptional regulator|uniref:TetR/AcrR family transcriptional regulator n=1 Tax=Flectobacillus sp. BAB-3569 TaxID=1509483 RepID=UPI000BA49088|nr:TetR/AcrR family transcriptional regulator [Flectobacillus sp. BAB-3569]NBA78833.1 TetR family transcriptional regulator [Emticicia sp. ODNR4P]PAC30750.1 TetR family transcriptional regulator [Flectobacillus sp. BAB-3569]